jgi:hypothetical protein
MAYAHFSTDLCFADMRLDFILDSLLNHHPNHPPLGGFFFACP